MRNHCLVCITCLVLLACFAVNVANATLELSETGFPLHPALEEALHNHLAARSSLGDDDDDDEGCPPISPGLARSFQASIHSVLQTGVGLVAVNNTRTTNGLWLVDAIGQRMRVVGDTGTGIAPLTQPTLALDMAWLPGPGWSLLNGQCRPNPPYRWSDSWDWVGCATFVGQVDCWPTSSDAADLCDRYAISGQGFYVSVDVWTTEDVGVPVSFHSSFLYSLGAGLVNSTTYYSLTDVSLGIPDDAFLEPPICTVEPVACPGGPDSVQTLTFTRIHPEDDWVLANHNIADLLGDVGYMCEIPAESADSLLTVFELTVNTTWGQYGLCNRGSCLGGTPGTVGHTGTGNYGQPLAGQCSENEDIGNWYSLDGRDECDIDQDIGDDGCAWKGPTSVGKTITHACLVDRGFLQACAEDERYPFDTAYAVVQAALLPEAEGGCPDVTASYQASPSSGSYQSPDFLQSPSTAMSSYENLSVESETSETNSFSSSDLSDVGLQTNITATDDGDGDLTSEADYVFIALSFGCMILACAIVSAVMAFGLFKYIKSRPQQFGWAIADDEEADIELDDNSEAA